MITMDRSEDIGVSRNIEHSGDKFIGLCGDVEAREMP